jgi:hypothetical protein
MYFFDSEMVMALSGRDRICMARGRSSMDPAGKSGDYGQRGNQQHSLACSYKGHSTTSLGGIKAVL